MHFQFSRWLEPCQHKPIRILTFARRSILIFHNKCTLFQTHFAATRQNSSLKSIAADFSLLEKKIKQKHKKQQPSTLMLTSTGFDLTPGDCNKQEEGRFLKLSLNLHKGAKVLPSWKQNWEDGLSSAWARDHWCCSCAHSPGSASLLAPSIVWWRIKLLD